MGNKSDDLERVEVSKKDGQDKARVLGAHIFSQVSAKTGDGVDKMFNDMGLELIKRDSSVSTILCAVMRHLLVFLLTKKRLF